MELGLEDILFHVEKTNTSALRLYERLGYKIFRDDGNRYLMGVYGGLWHGKRFI
jgi:ribosomal protein S18 acetylase RimI-like enzyme